MHRLIEGKLAWQAIGDSVVVLDLDSSTYLELNESAGVLLEALGDGADTPQLVALLVDRFEVEADQAAADVADFLDEIASLGWITT